MSLKLYKGLVVFDIKFFVFFMYLRAVASIVIPRFVAKTGLKLIFKIFIVDSYFR